MRHRKKVKKLNRTREHRKALLANLAAALFEHKRIKTTHAKAKAAQRFVERLITIAKKDTLHARRLVLARVRHKWVMHQLFHEIAPVYVDRNGGYTRVVRLGRRPGDGAEMSILELVGFEEAVQKKLKEKKEREEAKKEEKRRAEEEARREAEAAAEAESTSGGEEKK